MTPLVGGIGWQEILIVAAVIFILFGASRLPTAFRSLGEGLRSFKEGLSGNEAKASRVESDEGRAPRSAAKDRDREPPGSDAET